MPGYNTEADYENAIIELFRNDLGYEYVYGPDVERDFRSPLYDTVLEESLYRLNKGLPADAINDALFKLRNFENGELVQKNAEFMEYLQSGIPVRYLEKGEERSGIVYLADYSHPENNSFIVANQWTFIENSNKRPDIILFLNGLPVVLVELKSPSREETDASEAYRQLRNYMQEIPSMFIYNAICVMSDQSTSKAGTITSGEDRFMEWKTKDGSYENTQYAQFDTFFEGLFQKDRLLDIIKNFICFSNEGIKSFKILAGYHQYFAVRKAIESTKHATVTDGKGGVFWHTQGSGKSLSMVFYAHLLQDALDSPTIVVLTDRNDLDDQLYGQFAKCKKFLRQEPIHAESREHLKSLLAGRQANGIIFTTMQKFEESHEPLSERRNIAIQAFIKKQSANAAYYEENWNERKERKAYYQSFTKDKLLAMTEEDFLEYISRLWAVLMWGNKKYVVDKLIEDNGFSTLKKQLADLLYGSASVEKRWDIFLKSVKGMGPATISELLSYMNPQEYIVFNKTTILCYGYLGIPNMPKYNYQYTGKKYTEVCAVAKEIASSLKKAGAADSDLLAVDYFLWDEILPLAEKDVPTTDAISISQEPVSARDSRSLHDEIKDKLVDIGKLLGFDSRSEVKIATGAVVDAVWEAKIGNMGKAIYVFEVQSKGSIDSLILNLKKAQSNAAVQAVVAVADEEQLAKIIQESAGVIDEKSLRTWDSEDVLAVYDALVRAHESINKLALVPESF